VPELAALPDALVHRPWEADGGLSGAACGDYPPPLVDLKASREAALRAFETLRRGA
jgi:deoxyribodipyrimidine photo-lyase